MKKIIFGIILGMFLISLGSADIDLGTKKQNTCFGITQTCNNCTYANVSSIKFPNESIWYVNDAMVKIDTNYNYSFCDSSQLGTYYFSLKGDRDGTVHTEEGWFTVTTNGKALTVEESIVYIILTAVILIIFGFSLYFAIAIPFRNEKSSSGYVVQVTKKKYIKLMMIGTSYALFVWVLNLVIGLAYNFVNLTLYYGFVSFLFNIFLNLTFPVFMIIMVIAGVSLIRDFNFKKQLNSLMRGR